MRYEFGIPFKICDYNRPIPGCMISEQIYDYISVYSMAKDTTISPESKGRYRAVFVHQGKVEFYSKNKNGLDHTWILEESQSLILPVNIPIGVDALEDTVFSELILGRNIRNETILQAGAIFNVDTLVPYRDNEVVWKDLFEGGFMVFSVVSMDQNMEYVKEFSKAETLITALDGEAVVQHRRRELLIRFGECLRIPKGDSYKVRSLDTKFKMSILKTIG